MRKKPAPEENKTPFLMHFSELEDPRRTNKGNFQHLLSDILLLTISAMLCGVDDWPSVITFGKNQLEWLKKFGNFKNGLPSQDTFERVFAALNPQYFNQCFMNWMESIRNNIPGEVIAIDGKAMRGAKDSKAGKNMPHIVSAWASENGICLGQIKVSEKSNEITAIPDLVDAIVNKGCTITIDAMGCQKGIAKKIRENEADYILAVKGNQANLEQAIQDTVRFEEPDSIDVMEDCGHGRIETRICKAYSNLSHVENPDCWADLSTLFVIESHVYEKTTGKENTEQRTYITSLPAIADSLNNKTRSHWSVENNLHWVLDVTFYEDASRKRKDNEAENFNMLLKSTIALLANDKTPKFSKKRKRLQAALDHEYREKLLGF
jgi:predicted transposase YbfD/YdcC